MLCRKDKDIVGSTGKGQKSWKRAQREHSSRSVLIPPDKSKRPTTPMAKLEHSRRRQWPSLLMQVSESRPGCGEDEVFIAWV